MLLQEQVAENTRSSPVGGNALPPTTRELAQAIVVVEGREGVTSHPAIDTVVAAQTVERLGLDIVPEELLAEVREQRVKANQDAVMTRRKSLDRTAWALLAGMVGASALSLFLVYTCYLMYFKTMEMNRMLNGVSKAAATNTENIASSQKVIKEWKYPDASVQTSSTGESASYAMMTTKQPFADVRAYYSSMALFGQPGLENAAPQLIGKGADSYSLARSESNFSMSRVGGGEIISAEGVSKANASPQTAVYTRRNGQYEIVATIIAGADNATVINLVATRR